MPDETFYWELFCRTGRPDAYIDYIRSKEEKNAEEEKEPVRL